MVDDMEMDRDHNDPEKSAQVHTIDNIRVLGLSDADADFYANFSPAQRKKVIRKVRGSASRSQLIETNNM